MYKTYLEPLESQAEFQNIAEKLKKNKGILMVSGCVESQKANLAFALSGGKRCVVVCANDLKARAF